MAEGSDDINLETIRDLSGGSDQEPLNNAPEGDNPAYENDDLDENNDSEENNSSFENNASDENDNSGTVNDSDAANTNRSGDSVQQWSDMSFRQKFWFCLCKITKFIVAILVIVALIYLLRNNSSSDDDPFTLCQSEKIQLPFHPNGTDRFPEEGLYFIPCKAAHDFNVVLMKQVKGKIAEGTWHKENDTIKKEGGEDSFKKYSIHYALALARTSKVTYKELDSYWGKEYGKVKCFSISNWDVAAVPAPLFACDVHQAAYINLVPTEDRSLFPNKPDNFLHYTQGRVFLFAILHNSELASLMDDIVKKELRLEDQLMEEVDGFAHNLLELAKDDGNRSAMVSYMNGDGLRNNTQLWLRRATLITRSATALLRRLELSCMNEFKPEPKQKWSDCIKRYEDSEDARKRKFWKSYMQLDAQRKRRSHYPICSNEDLLDVVVFEEL